VTSAAVEVAPAPTPPTHSFDALAIEREIPDTARASEFNGHAMVQSFTVPLPDGRTGRCWITTSDAFRVPRFGRDWVASALREHAVTHGLETTCRALATGTGLRLHPGGQGEVGQRRFDRLGGGDD